MNEKVKFIGEHLKKERSLAELSRIFGISRKTGHKWVSRYITHGIDGLSDVNRTPKTHPNQTPMKVEEEIINFKHQHPHWGPRKLIHCLGIQKPETGWPAVSTAGQILKRHGLTKSRRRRRRAPIYSKPWFDVRKPNDVWATDFKGWFRTGDGTRIDPLTISDLASRYVIGCHAVPRPDGTHVKAQFERAFSDYGMPWAIRSDNGPPFASVGLGGLSRLSVWWIRLGIVPERIRPGHPEENGCHERFHRTLKQETARPPRTNPRLQQQAFDQFRNEFNRDRPHEALAMETPHQKYTSSNRHFPHRLPEVEYGPDFVIRRVRPNGAIKWKGEEIYFSEALMGEPVGFRQITEAMWNIHFGPILLATFDDSNNQLKAL